MNEYNALGIERERTEGGFWWITDTVKLGRDYWMLTRCAIILLHFPLC